MKQLDDPLIELVFAGALGSMMGTLLMETSRGHKPTNTWIFWIMLVIGFAAITRHPLLKGQLSENMRQNNCPCPPTLPRSTPSPLGSLRGLGLFPL